MKEVKMKYNVQARRQGRKYSVTDRFAKYLVKNDLADYAAVKKEEKAKPETKEKKPEAKTITKAVK